MNERILEHIEMSVQQEDALFSEYATIMDIPIREAEKHAEMHGIQRLMEVVEEVKFDVYRNKV